MRSQKFSWITAVLVGLALVVPLTGMSGEAMARSSSSAARSAKNKPDSEARRSKKSKRSRRRAKRARKMKVCRTRRGKRRCRWVPRFDGHGVASSKLRDQPLPEPSGDIWLYSVNSREEVKVNIYGANGEVNPEALAKLDHLFRCRRSGEERAVDPRLYEILSIIYDHFGQRRIELISGFRNQPNQGSRHFHASAMDIRIPGVPMSRVYEFATSLDAGGMGIGKYPTSDFVHVDWRAPGEKSYRWTDYSGPGDGKGKKRRRKRRNNS